MMPNKDDQKVFFIDAENVGLSGVSSLLEDKNHHVVLITGKQNKVDSIKSELANKRLDYIHTDVTRKELADKLLLAKVGEYAERYPDRQLLIISRDNDFKDAISVLNPHWDLEIRVIEKYPSKIQTRQRKSRANSAPHRNVSSGGGGDKSPPPKTPERETKMPKISIDPFSSNARWRRVAARFAQGKDGRKARESITDLQSLKEFIQNSMDYTGKESDMLIQALEKNGAISINDHHVSWN